MPQLRIFWLSLWADLFLAEVSEKNPLADAKARDAKDASPEKDAGDTLPDMAIRFTL
jgi:hypothetical protein